MIPLSENRRDPPSGHAILPVGPAQRSLAPPASPDPPFAPVPWHKKVTTRFFLWLFLALSLGFSILGFQIDRLDQKKALQAVATRLEGESSVLASSLRLYLEKGDLPSARALISANGTATADRAILVSPDGRSDMTEKTPLPAILGPSLSTFDPSIPFLFLETEDAIGERVFLVVRPLIGSDSCAACKGPHSLLGILAFYTAGADVHREIVRNRWSLFWMFSGILETLVLVVLLLIRRSLVRPLDGLSLAIARVTPDSPDLKLSLPKVKDDELGRLVFFLNRFIDLFRGWMGEVSDRVRWVEAHAELLARDHEKRYRKEEEVRLTLNELRIRVRDLLKVKPRDSSGEMTLNLSYIAENSNRIQQVTRSVKDSVQEARKVQGDLGGQGERLVRMRKNLSQALATVSEISREMHLTGINAAIEASHAGQYGRTFRIVADTVASLSKKTEGAVNVIGTELSGLSAELDQVVTSLSAESEQLDSADNRLLRFQERWTQFQGSLGKFEIQWNSVAERIRIETESLLKIQDIVDSLSEDFREQLVQKPLEERHLGEIMKVVKEINSEIDRFRI